METKKIILFLRKKIDGENSIEVDAYILKEMFPDIELKVLPEYDNSVKGMIGNILFAKKNQGDINHIIYQGGGYLVWFLRKRIIVTWHDVETLLQSKNIIKRTLRKLIWIILPGIHSRQNIICISNYTADALLNYCPWLKSRINIIYNPYAAKIVYMSKVFSQNCPIILHIGTGWRKNLFRVIESLNGIECELIIVGKLTDKLLQYLQENKIKYTAYKDIPFDTIIELYKQCDIVSFPSLYEGFGMPIVEANATGRVILTSRVASIPEIAGDAAHFVDPYSVQSIHDGFIKIITDEAYRESLIAKGLINAKRFTIENIKHEYEKLYNIIL
jgi:glycosyltransferase involved in cell wall biosynthesis